MKKRETMAKKFKDIILIRKRTRVEISGDKYLIDLKYYVNGRESYSAQIIRPDVKGRVRRLKQEGFVILQ